MEDDAKAQDSRTFERVTAAAALEKRASLFDRLRAWRDPNHWLSDARRTLMLAKRDQVYSCPHGDSPTPCTRCFEAPK